MRTALKYYYYHSGGDTPAPEENFTLALDAVIGLVGMGQSNMEGFHTDEPPTSPIDYTAAITGANMRTTGSTFVTLDYPGNNKGDNFGPELSMAYKLVERFGRPLYMDKVALSGSPLFAEEGRQDFNVSTAELYPALSASALAVKAAIVAQNKVPFMILVVIQGERDCLNNTTAAAWTQNMEDIVAQLAVDGVTFDAIVVNTLNDNLDVDPEPLALVQASQLAFIAASPDVRKRLNMNLFTLGADVIHYEGAAQIEIGEEIDRIIGEEILTTIEAPPVVTFANIISNLATPPPQAYQDVIEAFYNGCVADDIWKEIIEIQCRALDTEANSLRGWKNVAHATNNGGVHVAKSGFDYNGTSQYVATGFIASERYTGQHTLNDCGFASYCKVNGTATGVRTLIGTQDATPDRISLFQNSNISYRVNSSGATASVTDTSFANDSLYSIFRTASNSQQLWKNGVQFSTGNPTSTARPDTEIYEAVTNVAGTPANYFDGIISLFIAFRASTMDNAALNTRVQTLITDLAAIP